MLASLSAALREADLDREVRVIVLTGAGRGFCAGLDLKDTAAGTGIGGDGANLALARFDLAGSPPVVLHTTDKPVICALNGAAAGYGMDLALGCDIRIASSQAKLAAVFTRRGILPESGGSWLLPRLIGWAKAAEVAFRGHDAERRGGAGDGAREPRGRAGRAHAGHEGAGRRDRGQRAAGRAGDEANDAPGAGGDVRGERAPRFPAAPAAVPDGGLPGGRAGVPGEAPGAVPGASSRPTS